MVFGVVALLLKLATTNYCHHSRFLAGLTNRRREQAEQLAQKALEDARRQQEEERAAAAAAAAAAAQQNKTVSAPTTPVAPPSGTLREGKHHLFSCCPFLDHLLLHIFVLSI